MVLIRVDTPDGEFRGEVRPGESWAAAAARVLSDAGRPTLTAADLSACDLSGAPRIFAVDPDRRIALRPAVRGDLPDLVRWRQSPHVHRWWACDGEPTAERVAEQYVPDIDGATPNRLWIAELNGRSVAMVSDYLISDHPDYALLTPDPSAIGFDYAIGEAAWIGRGLGAVLIWCWLRGVRDRFPGADSAFAAPDHRNTASRRVLVKAGFREGFWFDEPQADGTVATVVGHSASLSQLLGAAAPS